VCKPRNEGGLRVRDVKMVNVSLLAKWRWRVIQSGTPLWKEVLVAKDSYRVGDCLREVWPWFVSRWWNDIVVIDKLVGVNWFNNLVVRKVGNRGNMSFWNDVWTGNAPLNISFPHFFFNFNTKESKVEGLSVVNEEEGDWAFMWRRPLFVWEFNLLINLKEVIGGGKAWSWKMDGCGGKRIEEFLRLSRHIGCLKIFCV